jgi:hypothetical protein
MRLIVAALAAAGALLVVAGAQAKEPPDGIEVCGAADACVQVSQRDAEPAMWGIGKTGSWTPAAPAPYYVLRWHWPGQVEQTEYYVPSAARLRVLTEFGVWWYEVDGVSAQGLTAVVAALEPLSVPKLSSVTVAGRAARDPQSYLRLLRAARQVSAWPGAAGWLPVKLEATQPSPWTDGLNDVRISKRNGFVWVDGRVFKISKRLAALARSGSSLD